MTEKFLTKSAVMLFLFRQNGMEKEILLQKRYNTGYFAVNVYEGIPKINEPEKCSDLQWFNVKYLPDSFIADRKQALQNYLSDIYYDETGWDLFIRTE